MQSTRPEIKMIVMIIMIVKILTIIVQFNSELWRYRKNLYNVVLTIFNGIYTTGCPNKHGNSVTKSRLSF